MAHWWVPDRRVGGIADVTPALLGELGVRAVISDLDNTLALPEDVRPTEAGASWLRDMAAAGIPVTVVSNNYRPRVEAFCRPLGVPFVERCGKPFGRGIRRAMRRMGVKRREVVLVGDQLFTDVLAASWNRIPCILTEPIVLETGQFFRCKRALERLLTPRKRRK